MLIRSMHTNEVIYGKFLGQEKNMCGSGYPTYPKLLPPTLNFLLTIMKLEKNSRLILFCYSLPTSEFGEKYTYQSDHLKRKSKFLCIQSLEVKGLKQGYFFKNRHLYISFFLFNTFSSRYEYSKKKLKNSFLPSYSYFFQGVTWTTHICLFGLSNISKTIWKCFLPHSQPINVRSTLLKM